MQDNPTYESQPQQPQKKGCSTGAILLGCSSIVLLGLIGIGVLGFFGYRWTMQQVDQFAAEYEEKGYERVVGQAITVDTPVDTPRVYVGQIIVVDTEVDADIALMGQVVEINGTVNGNIDFFGQILTIKPGAVVNGNINCKGAQVIQVDGTLNGEVTGSYQVVNNPNAKNPADADDLTVPDNESAEAETIPNGV